MCTGGLILHWIRGTGKRWSPQITDTDEQFGCDLGRSSLLSRGRDVTLSIAQVGRFLNARLLWLLCDCWHLRISLAISSLINTWEVVGIWRHHGTGQLTSLKLTG